MSIITSKFDYLTILSYNIQQFQGVEKMKKLYGKKRLLALLLSLAIPLSSTGCGKEETINTRPNSEEDICDTNLTKDYLQSQFGESFKETMDFSAYLNSLTVFDDYDFQIDDEDLIDIRTQVESTTKCEENYTGNIDNIVKNIKERSNRYSSASPLNDDPTLSPKEIRKNAYVEQALKDALKETKSSSINNFSEDVCHIKDIRIINKVGGEDKSSYNPDENIITINYEEIVGKLVKKEAIIEELTKVFKHEINHARQYICDCRKDYGQLYEVFDSKTLLEASAESSLYNLANIEGNTFDFIYREERKDEALLLLMGLLNDHTDITDYYNGLFDTNLDKLFRFFDIQDDKDLREFYSIIKSIDFENNQEVLDGEYEIIGYDYREAILKKCINNLIAKTNESSTFDIVDNMTIYLFVKNTILNDSHTYYKIDGKTQQIIQEDFVNKIMYIDSEYKKILSEHYGISLEEIEDIEKNEAYDILIAITNQIEGNIDYSLESSEKARILIARNPLLETIMFTTEPTINNFANLRNNYLKNKLIYEETLTLTK